MGSYIIVEVTTSDSIILLVFRYLCSTR